MAKIRQIQKSQSNFNSSMDLSEESIMSRLNCHNVGRIIEFDLSTQLCTVEMLQIKQFNDQYITPAPLTEVPLIILGAGGANITLPDPVGTICLILFMDRNIDAFIETGETYTPDTARMHDFTDAVAISTIKTLVNPVQNYDTNALSLMHEKLINEVLNQSYIKIYPDSIEITNFQAETARGSIKVGEKINIGNTSKNLADLIQNFLTVCENITVVTNTGVLTPEVKQQFTDLKTQFEELLTNGISQS